MATKPSEVTERKYYRVADIMRLADCSKSKAYAIIQQLNKELDAGGYITVQGRVSVAYANERLAL